MMPSAKPFLTGQTPVMKYHRALMMAVLHDRIHIANAVNASARSSKSRPVRGSFGHRKFERDRSSYLTWFNDIFRNGNIRTQIARSLPPLRERP
jgi:hypothetical protein